MAFISCQENNLCYTYLMSQDLFVVLHRRFVDGDDFHRWEKVDFVNDE